MSKQQTSLFNADFYIQDIKRFLEAEIAADKRKSQLTWAELKDVQTTYSISSLLNSLNTKK